MKALYKIITAILALLIFPALIFAPFFKVIVTSSVLSMFSSSSDEILLNDSYSLKEIYELLAPYKDTFSEFSISDIPQEIRDAIGVPAALFVGFLILAVLCALVVLILAIFTKKRKAIAAFSGLGIAFSLGMNISFDSLAKPLVSGTVSVTDLLSENILSSIAGVASTLGSLVSSLFGGSSELIDIRLLSLSGAYVFMLVLFIGILVWTISNMLVDWK